MAMIECRRVACPRRWPSARWLLPGLLLVAALQLSACASPAKVEGMTVTPAAVQTAAMPEAIRQNITLGMISGGEPTNPLWTSEVGNEEFRAAIEASLRSAGALAPAGSAGGYLLEASLIDVQQPIFGLDATVTSTVDYRVSPQGQEGRTFQTVVATPYTARMGEAFFGVQRLRLANEGAIRENIRQFIEQLVAFYGD